MQVNTMNQVSSLNFGQKAEQNNEKPSVKEFPLQLMHQAIKDGTLGPNASAQKLDTKA